MVPVLDAPPFTDVGLKVNAFTDGGLIVKVADLEVVPSLPVIVTLVCVPTAVVLTAKVAVVFPAATVTDASKVADLELLVSVTFIPPLLAPADNVTVPVEPAPPATVLGESVTEVSAGAVIVSTAAWVDPLRLAEIVAETCAVTAKVVIVNVAEVIPDPIVTVAGTFAEVELLVSFTVNPALGAGPVSITVPVEETDPATLVGLSVTDESPAGLTVSVVVCVVLPLVAVIFATCWLDTDAVVTVNVVELCPAATVTEAGTVTPELLLFSVIGIPPEPAAPLNMTVPVEEIPPTTAVGFTEIEFSVGGVSVNVAVLDTLPKVPVSVTAV
jgi:hypothetical protein